MSEAKTTRMDRPVPFSSPPEAPWPLVDLWLEEAEADSRIPYATAACLATVDSAGWPDARIVLASRRQQDAFLVLTDHDSPKARQLVEVPKAVLVFYWPPLERQIRLRCRAEPADDGEADALFEQRPRQSRGTAWASRQSSTLAGIEELGRRLAEIDERFAAVDPIPRPEHWRAIRLVPIAVELWQAAARRLHHRLLYRHEDRGGWSHRRLEP